MVLYQPLEQVQVLVDHAAGAVFGEHSTSGG